MPAFGGNTKPATISFSTSRVRTSLASLYVLDTSTNDERSETATEKMDAALRRDAAPTAD
jgi:hypothetical protein